MRPPHNYDLFLLSTGSFINKVFTVSQLVAISPENLYWKTFKQKCYWIWNVMYQDSMCKRKKHHTFYTHLPLCVHRIVWKQQQLTLPSLLGVDEYMQIVGKINNMNKKTTKIATFFDVQQFTFTKTSFLTYQLHPLV